MDNWGGKERFGPNARLVLTGESGEIIETGRGEIRVHGGRQEDYDPITKTWSSKTNPELRKTEGCLRAFDCDINEFKRITDILEMNDPLEFPGKLRVNDDLVENKAPKNYVGNSPSVIVTYEVPKEELDYWKSFINKLLNKY